MKFELIESEVAKFNAWNEKHLADHHDGEEPYTGAAGGRVTFLFFPTGLGVFSSAVCSVCKRKGKKAEEYKVELTDFSDW